MSRRSSLAGGLPLWPLAVVVVMVLALFVSIEMPQSVLASDAGLFRDRATEILGGRVPYFDAVYEHLPGALLPMLAVKLIPGTDQFATYALIFGTIMAAGFIACGYWVGKIGADAGEPRATMHWLALAGPLLPLVAFRVDVLSLLLILVAFHGLFVAHRGRGAGPALAGIATKGWPVVLAPVAWWAGRRRLAVAFVGFAVVLVGALSLTSGFREGRDFSGVHLETVAGSVLVWVRSLRGIDSGMVTAAGAAYVEAPIGFLLIGPALGGALLLFTRSMWRNPVSPKAAAQLVGVVTFALLLMSPLMSAQFLLWLTPWLIFFNSGRLRRMFVVAALLTVALLLHWAPVNLVWQSGLVIRNVLFVVMATELIRHARVVPRMPAGSRR